MNDLKDIEGTCNVVEGALGCLGIEYSPRILGKSVLCFCEFDKKTKFNLLASPDGEMRIWTHPVKNMSKNKVPYMLAGAKKTADEAGGGIAYCVTDDMDLSWEIKARLASGNKKANIRQTAGLVTRFAESLALLRRNTTNQ